MTLSRSGRRAWISGAVLAASLAAVSARAQDRHVATDAALGCAQIQAELAGALPVDRAQAEVANAVGGQVPQPAQVAQVA